MSDHQRTELLDEQTGHLQKALKRFDILFLIIAAVISLETLGQVSVFGAEALTWSAILAVAFVIPYALLFAEVGAAFSEEGGAYTWVRNAFGRVAGAIAALLTWVTQPIWVGGSMAFLAAETVNTYLVGLPHGSAADYIFKIVFIWCTVLAAVVSLRKGKWLPTSGAILKLALLAFFVLTTVVYAAQHGVEGLHAGDFSPTLAGLLGLAPVLLFAFLGFESSNSAAEEMENPARDVPISIARSSTAAALCYILPVLAILLVVPKDDITGISGLLEAVGVVFTVYGPAADALGTVTAIGFVYILMSQGAAWMIISDRMQAIAAADGAFFGGFFGRFHPRLGTPVRVNLLSGVVSTTFMVAAMQVTGSSAALFTVVLIISISTFLLSYLIVIPAAVRLRTAYPHVKRPFKVPVSDRGYAALGAVAFAWVLLGSWVAVFPGTLEALFGLDYDFQEIWGVSHLQFQVLTLGTLAGLLVLGVAGYVRGALVRRAVTAAAVPATPSVTPEGTVS
ncbi:APC family permease [Jiangella aurantiaca]|uniref:APC family permease n=1 Tax=Jiangella aurantiaca TaxID=2530373 RepID=A0A4R5AIE7_9ACTN|nr:APC family permease [Jiangella aurantiaca]TDD71260.1 APC family permease [Jiangella aurantiaca]